MENNFIEQFKHSATAEIRAVIKALKEDGLSKNISNQMYLNPDDNEIAIKGIIFANKHRFFPKPAEIPVAEQLAKAIVNAANERKIPVIHESIPLDGVTAEYLKVSPRVKEPEKYPEILLSALGAYAASQGKADTAKLANDAAYRMKALVAEMEKSGIPR